MRTRDEVGEEKLRGGFYSPDVLVDLCLTRAKELLASKADLRVLEPSSGDGAFLRGLERNGFKQDLGHVEAVELIDHEAEKSSQTLSSLGLPGRSINDNVLRWSQDKPSDFDLVLANPPYVRFQFIAEDDKQRARAISAELGAAGSSVSNLWIPVFLLAVSKLREGGVFSVILPTEFLTGISANSVRNWLLAHTTDLTIDLFKPGSFPAVLQEVLILTGRRTHTAAAPPAIVDFYDHNGGTRHWTHTIAPGPGTWTDYLLSPKQYGAIAAVRSIGAVTRLGNIARFSVSTVTGANGYFCMTSDRVAEYELERWALPLLPRSRYAEGLVYTQADQQLITDEGQIAWLLSFSADRPSPEEFARPDAYLVQGLRQEIDQRFKCRVRTPWYRVPVVPPGELLLSKRSNHYPRVIANHARVVTTDTIYKGQMLVGAPVSADDFTAVFHNSLTLLSAEVEGRSFGGGVLELVPSEVSALQVPILPGAGAELGKLDAIARSSKDPEALVTATDEMISGLVPALDAGIMSDLRDARSTLMDRRLQRTHSKFYG
ncbi:Eco57I restriction-modification methylase domain-containing protein [Zhihengliuella sp. ISTPL4]|uniref:Eco57I restriction-modification methylase domain-containing protein n=1 Tax=Zhihengliuella sp. ISTPL4 TaxID=2058657 RepID=UPI000C7BD065|nr:N-6 DNA methylase [Zhihengliuella sp. ISTPL4]